MGECRTLLVRNLPSSLSPTHVEELFKRFGACRIRLMNQNSRMKGYAFISFENHVAALEAMKRLHQLEVLDRRLIVVFSNNDLYISTDECTDFGESATSEREELVKLKKDLDLKLPAISETLGINYPLNIKQKYLFPPPNPSVVSRISNALVNVPKFYWQVLLLMNKMNLPPPFGPFDKAMPLGKGDIQNKNEELENTVSNEESELESEEELEEMGIKDDGKALMAIKRKSNIMTKTISKKRRIQSMLASVCEGGISTEGTVLPSEVFDVPSLQVQKKIEFKLNVDVEPESVIDTKTEIGNFGSFTNEASDQKVVEDSTEFVSLKELKENRISKEGMELLPVFKNYQPGVPSNKLYIKNLAKQTDVLKLKSIYGLFVDKTHLDIEDKFSIRLMKEGRMKGQAFITFPDEESAKIGLENTNGYILFDKPIVVQFAKVKS